MLPSRQQLTSDHESACMCHLYRLRIKTHVLRVNFIPCLALSIALSRDTCVKNSVHGGVCLSACWDITTPPPGAGTPRSRYPPEQAPPREQTPPLRVHAGRYGQQSGILLECNLVFSYFRQKMKQPFHSHVKQIVDPSVTSVVKTYLN